VDGARGVVLSVGWWFARVKVDDGMGFTTESVPISSLRVVRRGVGEQPFTERARIMHLARLGVALVMLAPLAAFMGRYVEATGGTDGLAESIASGAVLSALGVVNLVVVNPIGTALYLATGWGLWRFAFPGVAGVADRLGPTRRCRSVARTGESGGSPGWLRTGPVGWQRRSVGGVHFRPTAARGFASRDRRGTYAFQVRLGAVPSSAVPSRRHTYSGTARVRSPAARVPAARNESSDVPEARGVSGSLGRTLGMTPV
jgi:hypothetical protein